MSNNTDNTNDWLQRLQPGDKVVVVKEDVGDDGMSGGVQRRTHNVMSVNSTHICVDYTSLYRKSDGQFDSNPNYMDGYYWMSTKPFLQEYTPEFEAEVDAAWRNFNEVVLNMSWPML